MTHTETVINYIKINKKNKSDKRLKASRLYLIRFKLWQRKCRRPYTPLELSRLERIKAVIKQL